MSDDDYRWKYGILEHEDTVNDRPAPPTREQAFGLAQQLADERGRPMFIREIGVGIWRIRERSLPYYNSTQRQINPRRKK